VDSKLTEGGYYDYVTRPSLLTNADNSLGGPAYLEVGLDEVLDFAPKLESSETPAVA